MQFIQGKPGGYLVFPINPMAVIEIFPNEFLGEGVSYMPQ